MKNTLLACTFFCALAAVSLPAFGIENPSDSPYLLFLQPQTFPPFAGVMPFFHEETRTLPPGKISLHSALVYFNTFRQDNGKQDPEVDFFLDMEGTAWSAEGRYSPLENWEISSQLQVLGGYPGIMDPFLSSFHSLFGFPNQSREYFPENDFRWSLTYRGEELANTKDSLFGITQFSLGVKYILPYQWSPQSRLGAKFWIKPPVPAARDFFLSSGWSVGAGLLYSDLWTPSEWRAGEGLRWGLSGGAGLVQAQEGGLQDRILIYHGGFHAGVLWNRYFLGAQGALFQSPFDLDSNYLGVRSGEVHIGLKGPWGPYMWEAALVEEFLTWGAMEVGFHTGVSWTF